ncbi:MAG: Peroxisome chaperone and import receptor [Peltula sp. TS41687]|nr:MAG: Peroxisome chaperone and import receptor [Peltula sp. TS41687]
MENTSKNDPPNKSGEGSSAAEGKAPVQEEDDDSLDDLDDILDEFSVSQPDVKDGPSTSGPGRPPPEPAADAPQQQNEAPASALDKEDDDEDEDFARQLQAGMKDLLGEIENSSETREQFETLVKELGDIAAAEGSASTQVEENEGLRASSSAAGKQQQQSTSSSSNNNNSKATESTSSFQETIRQTMQRMQASGEQATAAATSSETSTAEDDVLAAMLKQMQGGGGGDLSGAPENEEEFSKMLMGMMEQLTNKEILYEPMKELHDKFPGWMEKNRATAAKDDLRRYEEQQGLVAEIVAKFEQRDYSDANVAYREYIVERMQKMQAAGSPPPDLVGDMGAAQDALNDLDAGCPQQ